jgi:hypothetical protein
MSNFLFSFLFLTACRLYLRHPPQNTPGDPSLYLQDFSYHGFGIGFLRISFLLFLADIWVCCPANYVFELRFG